MDYSLPRTTYMQTIWFIKSYDEKLEEYKTVAYSAPEGGIGRSSMPGDPTGSRGLRAARLSQDLKAVDDALKALPEYYREPVLENTLHRKPWPTYSTTRTFKRYKRKFVYHVARNAGFI